MIAKLPYLAAAFVLGVMLAAQPAVNAEAARHSGEPLAAAILSLAVSLAAVLPFALLIGSGRGLGWLAELPWWAWFGGLTGAGFVLGSLIIVPVTGAVVFFGCVLFGQVIGAAMIDQFGALNMAVRPIGVERAVAIGLVLAGIVVFLRAS